MYQKSIQDFILEYSDFDTNKLRLKNIQADFDVAWAIQQIEARKKIRDKLPTWASNMNIVFPSILSTEQCSSELTARYKQNLIIPGDTVDLTGGLGVDSFFFSQKSDHVVYVEQLAGYCRAAKQNFKNLCTDNITVMHDNCINFLQNNDRHFQNIYIDPARRSSCNKRIFAIDECEPNVIELMPVLFQCGKRIIIKVSPMVDITATLSLLPDISEVHVVSVKNECKELLLVIDTELEKSSDRDTIIHCIQINSFDNISDFTFGIKQEKGLPYSTFCKSIKKYLYEPNTSILKAGAYKSIAIEYDIEKLQANSHLYTSDNYISNFPGRKFEIIETVTFNSKNIKDIKTKYPQTNLSTRNFPLTTAELQKKLKTKDGGDLYLFATTLSNDNKVLIICKKATNA